MKRQKINGHILEMYDSIDELPMERFHKFNKFLMIDAGVGSDISDIVSHIDKISVYINKDKNSALKELQNLKENIYLVMEGVSPKHLALMPLIKKIDGKVMDDLSDEGAARALKLLSDTSHSEVDTLVDGVKKKLNSELLIYFPEAFNSADISEYYALFRKRILLSLDAIIDGVDKGIASINEELLTFQKPEQFSGSNSLEVQADKQYAAMNMVLAKHFSMDSKNFTVLEFYTALDEIRKRSKVKQHGRY